MSFSSQDYNISVFAMERMTVERITMVGGGRHMRLRLRTGHHSLNAIYFSATPESTFVQQGDVVDIAFTPQINEFRGERTVQMNVLDIRPSCCADCSPDAAPYRAMQEDRLTADIARILYPDRTTLAMVWRYLAACGDNIQEAPLCLCRKIVRWSGKALSLGQLMVCLDIFRDVGLLQTQRLHKYISIRLTPGPQKADLSESPTLQRLLNVKESD